MIMKRIALLGLLTCWVSACVVNPVPTPGNEDQANANAPTPENDAAATDSNFTGTPSGTIDAGTSAQDTSQKPTDVSWEEDTDSHDDALAVADIAPKGDASTDPGDAGGSCLPATGTLQVLFLGNSYTSVNNLPELVQQLSGSLTQTVAPAAVTKGNWSLGGAPNDHASDPDSLAQLTAKPWAAVVLQEQSQIPVIPSYKSAFMEPGAAKLVNKLQSVNTCARVLFFLTWGRKAGGKQCAGSSCSANFANFDQMQDALTAAYLDVAKQVGGAVVPVGEAWRKAIAVGGVELFSDDGSHPSIAGSYLAAATFHAALFKQSPAGAKTTAGVSDEDAVKLLAIAASTVLDDLQKWGL